jgi:hypothetical protein
MPIFFFLQRLKQLNWSKFFRIKRKSEENQLHLSAMQQWIAVVTPRRRNSSLVSIER